MSADEPQQIALPTPRFATRLPSSRGETIVGWLGVVLITLAIIVGFVLPHALPDGARPNSHLSDIGILLFIAGAPFFLASTALSDRRQRPQEWPEHWRRLRQSWSLRCVLTGFIVLATFEARQAVADLSAPPNPYGPSVELPGAAFLAVGVALCLALLGMVLALPELLWRSWRDWRTSRGVGQSEE